VITECAVSGPTTLATAILTPVMHAELSPATVTTAILISAMLTDLRPAAVATVTLTSVMVTDPSPIAVTTIIPYATMFTPLIERLQLILPPPLVIRHLEWMSAIYSVPSNIFFLSRIDCFKSTFYMV
jgi:hypothetical protein